MLSLKMDANYLSFENSDFSNVFSTSLSSLLNTSSICDVSLVCDDGQMAANKVVLSASSTFFNSVFTLNPHPHPLFYMRGVTTDLLQSVLQFIYTGATAVREEHVSSFLALGEDLKIAGLVGYQGSFAGKESIAAFAGEESIATFADLDAEQQEETKDLTTSAADLEDTDNISSDDLDRKAKTAPSIKLENIPDPLQVEKKEIAITRVVLNQRTPLPKPIPATGFRTSDIQRHAGHAVSARPPVRPVTSKVR